MQEKPVYKCIKEPKKLAKFLGLEDKYFYEDKLGDELEKKFKRAKEKQRSSVAAYMWTRNNYCSQEILETLYKNANDNIERVNYTDLSVEEFNERFEKPEVPCVIKGIPQAEGWDLDENWTWNKFVKTYGEASMKIAESDNGKNVRAPCKEYYKYLLHQKDDSPLYMFQSSFNKITGTSDMIEKYTVPKYFNTQLLGLMGEKRRPPYRWFLIGPKRSGSTLHTDPNMTSAWNTSLNGHKLWVMFPYDYPKWIVNGKNVKNKGEDTEAIDYFWHHLSRIKQQEGELPGMIECIQYPGETIFVPGGWWHAVLNLDDTMAVTQNYCSEANFDKVWRSMRVGRKKLCEHFFKVLKEKNKKMYRRALELNREDSYVFISQRKKPNFVLDNSTPTFTDSSSSSSDSITSSDNESENNDKDTIDAQDPELLGDDKGILKKIDADNNKDADETRSQ